ncbi:porin [bacterium AH-315-K03]|nr:porin [bacterium AH-315-K03]
MKQKLLALTILSASLSSHGTLANDLHITVYGKANISLNQNDFEQITDGRVHTERDNWTLNSNASRIGVKGDVRIDDTLQAIFKAEYEVFIDDGNDGKDNTFAQRDIYVGLQHPWGTLLAGRKDTPLKRSQAKVDRFNNLDRGDIKYVLVGENRVDNIIVYTSPTINGISVSAAFMPGEDNNDENDHNKDDSLADHRSVSISYQHNDLYLAAAIDDNVLDTDIVRLVAQYQFNSFKIGALYQTAERNGSATGIGKIKGLLKNIGINYDKQDAYLLSGEWKRDKLIYKAQCVYAESSPVSNSNLNDLETTQISLGADYRLNNKSKLFGYYSYVESDLDRNLANTDVADSTLGIGFEIKF